MGVCVCERERGMKKIRKRRVWAGLRDHDRIADLIVAHRSIDLSAISKNFIL